MKDQIYALYYEYADQRQYFYVGRTIDPKRRLGEHRSNVKNRKHTEDVYQFIRERCEPNGIPVWDMEVMWAEPNSRPEDCEDFWVVLLIRAGYDLKNMKHGDLHRIALELLSKEQGEFETVDEFVEFRTRVERETYERSEKLKREVLGEDAGDPVLMEMIRNNAERFRIENEATVQRQLKKEARARANAIEKAEWLKNLKGNDNETSNQP